MPIHEFLRLQADRVAGVVSLGWLVAQTGASMRGLMVAMAAMPSMLPIPGIGNVTGTVLMGMALLMARGHAADTLPDTLARFRVQPRLAARMLRLLAAVHEWADRRLRQRCLPLVSPNAWICSSVPVAIMGLVIFLPIPLGNVLGAWSLIVLGLGHGFRDGWVVALGWLMSLATLAYSAALFWGAAALAGPAARLLGIPGV